MGAIKVRKKPVEVNAVELTEELHKELKSKGKGLNFNGRIVCTTGRNFTVETLEGDMNAIVGDYLIIGVKGEIYPCRKDIFLQTYDFIESSR